MGKLVHNILKVILGYEFSRFQDSIQLANSFNIYKYMILHHNFIYFYEMIHVLTVLGEMPPDCPHKLLDFLN